MPNDDRENGVSSPRDAAEAARTYFPEADFSPGIEVGQYRLREPMGAGAMGVAWLADDLPGKREVVLKFITPQLQQSQAALKRVERAFAAVHALHHRYICPTYQFSHDARFGSVVVMQRAEGQPLDAYRLDHGDQKERLSLPVACEILGQVAEALDYAHFEDVIHNDIKPENIMVGVHRSGHLVAQLIDFGLAHRIRRTMTRYTSVNVETPGTMGYQAPELAPGELGEASVASDQYALGATAYELLSGRLPLEVADLEHFHHALKHIPPAALPGQSDGVNAALQRALAKDPGDRFETCAAFVEALANERVIKGGKRGHKAADRHSQEDVGAVFGQALAGGDLAFEELPDGDASIVEAEIVEAEIVEPRAFAREKRISGWPFNGEEARRRQEATSKTLGQPKQGKNSIGMRFRLIPTGEFLMGSPESDTEASTLSAHAWYGDNADKIGEKYAHEVGQKKPNAFGLYDMHGNLWEWCSDCYGGGYYADSPVADPTGPSSGSNRVLRGGCWYDFVSSCRSAIRYWVSPGFHCSDNGFRVALVLAE